MAVMLVAQVAVGPLLDQGVRPPRSADVRAAEQRNGKQLPVIVRICREALRSGDIEKHLRSYADRNGLSTYGRLALTMDCNLYKQGMQDSKR